jgi:hypothetical protein
MISARLPDGTVVKFPDGTSQGDMNDVINRDFAQPQAAEQAPEAVQSQSPVTPPAPEKDWMSGLLAGVRGSFNEGIATGADFLATPGRNMAELMGKNPESARIEFAGIPLTDIAADQRGAADMEAKNVQANTPDGLIASNAYELANASINMLPSIVTAKLTKKGDLGLAVMGMQVYSKTLTAALNEGKPREVAVREAIRSTAYEIGFEKMFGFFDNLNITKGAKAWGKQVLAETISESATEAAAVNDEYFVQNKPAPALGPNPGYGSGDFMSDLLAAEMRGGKAGFQGAVMGGGFQSPSLLQKPEAPAPVLDHAASINDQSEDSILERFDPTLASPVAEPAPTAEPDIVKIIQDAIVQQGQQSGIVPGTVTMDQQTPVPAPQPAPVAAPPVVEPTPEPIQERTEPTVAEKIKAGAEAVAKQEEEAEKPVDGWKLTEEERVAHQEKVKAQNLETGNTSVNPNYTHRAYRKGSMFEALEQEDGTWLVRRKPNYLADFGEWTIQDTVDTQGLRPIRKPVVQIKGGEFSGKYKIGEKEAAVTPEPKGPPDLLQDLAAGPQLNAAAFMAEFGWGPNDLKGYTPNGVGTKGVFAKEGGMTPQEFSDWLIQEKYLMDQADIDGGGESTASINEALDYLHDALGGDRKVSQQYDKEEADYQAQINEINEWTLAEEEAVAQEDMDAALDSHQDADYIVEPTMSRDEVLSAADEYYRSLENVEPETSQGDIPGNVGKETLIPEATSKEKLKAAQQAKNEKRDGLGRDLVEPEQGEGELLAGEKPVQTDIEDTAPAAKVEETVIVKDQKQEQEPPANQEQAAPEGKSTSTKNAVTTDEREARNLDPVMKQARQKNKEQVDRAEEAMKDNPQLAQEIVDRLNNDPNPSISVLDEAVLFVHKIDMRLQARAIADRASNEKLSKAERRKAAKDYGDLLEKMEKVDTATHASGAVWGRFGQLRSQMLTEDYSFEAQARAARVTLARPLTEEENTFMTEQAAEIDRLTEVVAKKDEEIYQAKVMADSEAAYDRLAEKYGKGKPKKKKAADLVKTINKAADESRAWLKSNLHQKNMAVDPRAYYHMTRVGASHIANGITALADWIAAMKNDLGALFNQVQDDMGDIFIASQEMVESERIETGEIAVKDITVKAEALSEAGELLDHRTIYNLARAFILQGVSSEQAVMEAVHKVAEQVWEGTTERDVRRAFSEYGKVKHPSKDADKKALAELRVLVRLQESIDRLTDGLPPRKTGQQRDKATQKIREKQKALNYLMKRYERNNPVPNEDMLASVNEQRITRLTNRLADLEKQERTGQKPVKGEPVADSQEVKDLKAKIQAVKDRLQEIENAKNPPRTAEQKQLDHLGSLKARLDERLRLGAPQMKKKRFKPLTEEARQMNEEVETLRKAIAELRKANKPKTDPAAVKERAQLKALEKSIQTYEDRIINGDFSALTRKSAPASARVKAMQELRDARRQVYNDMKKASKPVLSPEEIYNKRRGQQMRRQLKEVVERQRTKDYAKRVRKVAPELTKENKKLANDLMKAKMKFHEEVMEWDRQQMTKLQSYYDFGRQSINLSRAAITSIDLSAVLRQGGFQMLANPFTTVKAFVPMMRALRSDANANAVNDEIIARANFDLYQKSGLHLSEQDSAHPTKMEEVYMGRWQRKVPLIAASGRAYVTFLNKLRADTFDASIKAFSKNGEALSMDEMKQLAYFINNSTGRSDLGRLNSEAISDIFFAPRWVVSRFNMAFGIPLHLILGTSKFSPRMRRHVARKYAQFTAGFMSLYGLAALAFAGDADDDDPFWELDPRSSDFGKLKIGNTRMDMMAGLSQPIVFMARAISGGSKGADGQIRPLRDDWRFGVPEGATVRYGQRGTDDLVKTFLRSKFSPPASALSNMFVGETVVGETYGERAAFVRDVLGVPADIAEFPLLVELVGMTIPLSMRDFVDAAEEQGIPRAAAFQILATLGVSMNTYDADSGKKKGQPKRQGRPTRPKREARD